jgi:hypothetical protein
MHSIKNQPAWLKHSAAAGSQGAASRPARSLTSTRPHSGTATALAGVLTGVSTWK